MRIGLYIIVVIIMLLSQVEASAQYYEGEAYVPPCEHKGTQELWEIISYRPGMSSWDRAEGTKGKIRFSDSCIEIDCHQLVLSFGVERYERRSARNFKVFRSNPDDLFDYMEVRPALGDSRGNYWVFLGRLDERGFIQGTVQLTCRPYKRAGGANPRPSVDSPMSK
jgi:hypothetical protein